MSCQHSMPSSLLCLTKNYRLFTFETHIFENNPSSFQCPWKVSMNPEWIFMTQDQCGQSRFIQKCLYTLFCLTVMLLKCIWKRFLVSDFDYTQHLHHHFLCVGEAFDIFKLESIDWNRNACFRDSNIILPILRLRFFQKSWYVKFAYFSSENRFLWLLTHYSIHSLLFELLEWQTLSRLTRRAAFSCMLSLEMSVCFTVTWFTSHEMPQTSVVSQPQDQRQSDSFREDSPSDLI